MILPNARFITIKEAARMLGVSQRILRTWEKEGILIPLLDLQRAGTHYLKSDVEKLAKQNKNEEKVGEFEFIELFSKEPSNFSNHGNLDALKSRRRIIFTSGVAFFSFFLLAVTISGNIFIAHDKSQPGVDVSKSGGSEVLAAATEPISQEFKVSIPASFNKNVDINSDLNVNGTISIGNINGTKSEINLGAGSIFATNIIYGVTAGSGLSVSTGQTPTISNTGVLSIGGETGAINLAAGSGISISGTTITNTQTQTDAFKNIVVGADTISASSSTDTLTFSAGTGISFSADTGTKIFTISSSVVSGSGDSFWSQSSGSLYPINSTVDLLIGGQATTSAVFAITGLANINHQTTATISGNLSIYPNNGYGGALNLNGANLLFAGGGTPTITFPNSTGTICTDVNNCSFALSSALSNYALGTNWWTTSSDNKAIVPINSTMDFLIGGQSTSSAKFRVSPNGNTVLNSLALNSAVLGTSSASLISAYKGFNGFTNFSGGIGTGGLDSITNAQRLTSTGNLVNIGSYQGGEMFLTGSATLSAKVDYATLLNPQSVAVGDLNGDGKADLAVANSSSNKVSVLMNNGDGTFATKVDYATGTTPYSVAVGDLNGDGRLDLVVANRASATVSTLINKGNGTFTAKVDYTTGTTTYSVAVGDLNGDGRLDLVTTDWGDDKASVLMNNGDGTFASRTTYTTGTNPQSVAVGDLNGDGKADLAIADFGSNRISVLTNNGDGTFATKVDYATGTHPMVVAIGDLTGDGKADLAAVNNGSATVSVLINTGSTFATKVDYTARTSGQSIAIGDLTGDGKADLVSISSIASVFMNNGDGTFAPRFDYITGTGPHTVAIGDLNGDGKADVVTGNYTDNTISVFINQSSPIFFAQVLTGRIGIGIASTPSATLDVRGGNQLNAGTLAVASVSGTTSFASLIANNDGLGALFTASKSGATKFVINNDGTLSFAGTQNVLTTIDTANATARTITIPSTVGNDTFCLLTAANCGSGGGGTSWFNLSNGSLFAINSTLDTLLGGNSTSSAAFRVIGQGMPNAGTLAAATVSANTSFAGLIIDQKGSGDILSASNSGSSRFSIKSNGQITVNNYQNCTLKTDSTGLILCGTDVSSGTGQLIGLSQYTGASDTNYTTTSTTLSDLDSANVNVVFTVPASGSVLVKLTANAYQDTTSNFVYFGIREGSTQVGNIQGVNDPASGQFIGMTTASFLITGLTPGTNHTYKFAWKVSGGTGRIYRGPAYGAITMEVWDAGTSGGVSSPFSETLGSIIQNNTTEDLLLGGISTASARFHFYGNTLSGTNPVASISGNTSFSAFVIDNAGVGPLFTASSSGLNRFTIFNNGNIGINTTVSTNPITVGTDNTNGNGANLSAGGAWNNGSSREFKDNITPISDQDILNKINQLSISEWNYNVEDPSVKHIGPFAEDFYNIFGVGNDNKHISTIDPAGIALVGIKALTANIKDLTDKVIHLQDLVDRQSSASGIFANSTLNANITPVGNLDLESATVSGSLMVLGKATLNDVGITGKINSGLLVINGLDDSVDPQRAVTTINTLGGDLYLQNLGLGGIDILSGKIKIDKMGNINVQGKVAADKIEAKEISIKSDQNIGDSVILAGKTQIIISSTAMKKSSKVFITPTTELSIPLVVSVKNDGSFTVSISKAQSTDVGFDWMIVGTK